MILSVYRFATQALGPLISLYLERRKARGKEDPTRFEERLGHPSLARPQGPLVWAHAASVGEALSLLGLIQSLVEERPHLSVLVTTGTVTSADIMRNRLPSGAFHQYLPVDRPAYVESFLAHWRPDLALWAESEFWPNILLGLGERKTPLVLLNGRISDKSYRSWKRFSGMIGQILSPFSLCLGQSQKDADRLKDLGAPLAECCGNLKFAAPPLPHEIGELSALRGAVSNGPVWIAASTHAGEEEIVTAVHSALLERFPKLTTIIAPRHPQRGDEIAALLPFNGFTQRSTGAAPEPGKIYLADTMGEMGLWFRLASIAFMGKSLLPLGGQNPIEPARLDCAILFGPHMGNFDEISAKMKESGAALEVSDQETLTEAISSLLDRPDRRADLAQKAEAFAASEADVTRRVLDRLKPWLDQLEPADENP